MPAPAADLTFLDYARAHLGWGTWVLARRCPRLESRGYDTFLSHKDYADGQRAYLRDGGDPDEVSPQIAAAMGFRRAWVRDGGGPVPRFED